MCFKYFSVKTHYWLFKKTNEDSNYYYVRIMTDGLDRINWVMGYENHFGSVSIVGGGLTDYKQKELEAEFQQKQNKLFGLA